MYPVLFIVHYCVNALCLVGSRNKTWFHFVKYINGINLFIYHTDAFLCLSKSNEKLSLIM
jgi:hypothetical protein